MTIHLNNLTPGDDLPAMGFTQLMIAPLRDASDPGDDGTQMQICTARDRQFWSIYGILPTGESLAVHDATDEAELASTLGQLVATLEVPVVYLATDYSTRPDTLIALCERLTEQIHDEIPGHDDAAEFREDDFDTHPLAGLREALCDACAYNGPVDAFGGDNHGDDIGVITLDADERATIIAALTDWLNAGMGDPDNRTDKQQAMACPNDNSISLDDIAILALIERLQGVEE